MDETHIFLEFTVIHMSVHRWWRMCFKPNRSSLVVVENKETFLLITVERFRRVTNISHP